MSAIFTYKIRGEPWLRWLPALAVATCGVWLVPAVARDGGTRLPQCEAFQVPVSLTQVPGATLYGELCVKAGASPSAVQLLVHGATYNSYYNDWPYRPDFYAYVRQMTDAGYATLNIERLGYGRSTHPTSDLVSLANGAEALHQVVQQLRNGKIGGRTFTRVIWVGHSLGTLYAWHEAQLAKDVDAFVLTGLLHTVKPSWKTLAFATVTSATADPKFATSGLDANYLTFQPGPRGELFYLASGAEPAVIALDERLKDTVSGPEFGAALPEFDSAPPATAPSQAIKVPTLLVVGQHDRVMCTFPGDSDGLVCNSHNILAQEMPYYSGVPQLDVLAVPNTGHDLQLHRSAPATGEAILDWLSRELGAESQ